MSSCDNLSAGGRVADVVHTGDVQPARDPGTRPSQRGLMTSLGGFHSCNTSIPTIDFGLARKQESAEQTQLCSFVSSRFSAGRSSRPTRKLQSNAMEWLDHGFPTGNVPAGRALRVSLIPNSPRHWSDSSTNSLPSPADVVYQSRLSIGHSCFLLNIRPRCD
jgi:hypothetical protein